MKNLREGTDFYYDESGLMVLTEEYHLARGFCCGNGCRHCPYEYKNVDADQRKELQAKRTDETKKQ